MAHESFEDPATAALMNEHFVNIKVDREERPDVDAVYMEATQALTGQGGWPMTVFLDPARRAVLRRHLLPAGAAPRHAVVPAAARGGRPQAWRGAARRGRAGGAGRASRPRCARAGAGGPRRERARRRPTLDAAVAAAVAAEFDAAHGGFGGAPKFPPSMVLEFLLRAPRARTGSDGDAR